MNDLSEFVVLSDTTLTTDSRRVAKHFKKTHSSVLRAFDNLDCSDAFSQRNFAPRDFTDSRGKRQREISMTKDGFVFLAMGFQGAEAARFKEAFINAFNAMAEQLQRIGNSLWAQRLDLEKREATSFMWASFGGKCMVKRKQEKPLLEDEMQPALFKGDTPSLTH